MHNIAIIGSGPTAIYTAHYLLALGEPLSITLFEAQKEAGKGTPYHQDWNDAQMLANIASIEIPPIMQTLVGWLEEQSDDALARMGICREEIDERAFFPRVALGEYFKEQLQGLVRIAPEYDCTLDIRTMQKVLDVRAEKGGMRLTVQNGGQTFSPLFDYVVMATGHAWPRDTETRPGYFLSPWPASSLGTIGNCAVGILGSSLSAIDAAVALSVARGAFMRGEKGELQYLPEPGTEDFSVTMLSRKGLLPEADFYYPLPYTPLGVCSASAIDRLISETPSAGLLDRAFSLFKEELITCDRAYAQQLGIANMTLEEFSAGYFKRRETQDPFAWAERDLAEARENAANEHTVAWRYAILRMHEVMARLVPHLLKQDHQRFHQYLKPVFVDNYATVPHESIERMLALRRAGKLSVQRLDADYKIEPAPNGATITSSAQKLHFPAFIEAMGQKVLSPREFPFPSLWEQGLIREATAPYFADLRPGKHPAPEAPIGGIALDSAFHPLSDSPKAARLYCLSLPFLLSQFPFAQGITSSHEMGKRVAKDMARQFNEMCKRPIAAETVECAAT